VVDATGAGDLFVAAYAWADARGLPVDQRIAWATLSAGLSVRAPTALTGAPRLAELLDEGMRRGLTPPTEPTGP
jgi:sugar/nucleoside kinase (ribokinase family)